MLSVKKAFSAEVELELVVGQERLELAQAGPHMVILDRGSCTGSLPPCDAEVVMRVDGRPHHRPVRLVEGISPDSTKVKIVNR